MELQGTVHNGVIIVDAGSSLPEGTRVTIVVEAREKRDEAIALKDRLLKLAGAIDDLPSDMARNHDHYIHGVPKRNHSRRPGIPFRRERRA
jgi:hypothetical protein